MEDLAPLAITYTEPADQVLTVHGLPARLRLIVMAPASRGVGSLDEDMADKLLDCIQPGMGVVVTGDYPRVRVWPPQAAGSRFSSYFERFVPLPRKRRQRSHWALLAGTISCGRQQINLGLALYTEVPNRLGHVHIPKGRWRDYLGVAEPDDSF